MSRGMVKGVLWCLLAVGAVSGWAADQQATFEVEFTNTNLVPSHWTLKLNPDGSGQFDADGGHPGPQEAGQIWVGEVHRPVQLSAAFTDHVFATARMRKLFAMQCESHMKVAFQGMKKLTYMGPEGTGSCEFNYSKDKEIEDLGSSLMAVEYTIVSGARLEKLLQHDRLGLDQELENLVSAAKDGNAIEMGAIRNILTRLADDEQVMERARKKARLLLVQAH